MITAYERPGVYSDYTVNSVLYSSSQNNIIGIVGVHSTAQINTVFTIQKLSDAQTYFGLDTLMGNMCKTALANGAYKIKAIVCAHQNAVLADYEASFAILEQMENIKIIMCDSSQSTILSALQDSIEDASAAKKERIGIVATTKSNAGTLAQSLNCERLVMVCQTPIAENNTVLSEYICAAAVAGRIANNGNPSNSFNSAKLYGMYKITDNYSEADVEDLLSKGVTVLETIGGNIQIIRLVTTRTKTGSQSDKTFHELSTVLTIDDVIPAIRQRLSPLIGNVKNNSKTLNAIKTQVTVELENKKKAELIDTYSQPNVYLSEQDTSICVVEVEFTVSRGINQIVVSAIINV